MISGIFVLEMMDRCQVLRAAEVQGSSNLIRGSEARTRPAYSQAWRIMAPLAFRRKYKVALWSVDQFRVTDQLSNKPILGLWTLPNARWEGKLPAGGYRE